jgi:surfeit locus 1 family protein
MRMRAGAFEFVPGLLPTAAAAALVILTVSLAHWQAARAGEKRALQALYEQRLHEPLLDLSGPARDEAPLFRHVRADGEYLADAQLFIDNQVHEGRAGFSVVTPLRLAGTGDVVLVERGWIERDAKYPAAPAVSVPPGRVAVTGIAVTPPRRYLELGPDTVTGNVWQNLSIERFRAARRENVLPFVLAADAAPPGLAVVRERPDTGIERHIEYELTWYSLAATTVVLWLALNWRRRR